MDEKLDKKLVDTFPYLYADRHGVDMRSTAMCWGFQVNGNGWDKIIWNLSKKLEALILEFPENKRELFKASTVKEKYGCYDSKTEVLTIDGWKYFKDITMNDKIACLYNGKDLVYENPSDIISYEYNGEMYKLETRGVDLLVTPNHNLYVSREPSINGRYKPNKYTWYPFELVTYLKYFQKNKVFKKDAMWVGEEIQNIEISGYSYTSKSKSKN